MIQDLIWQLRYGSSRVIWIGALAAAIALGAVGLAEGRGHGAGRSQTVVIDATATANEPRPVLPGDDIRLLTHIGMTSTGGIVWLVEPGGGEPTKVALTPLRPDGQVDHGPDRLARISSSVSEVARRLGREAATSPPDLLQAMAAVARVTPGPATAILVSSGVTTTGGFDLRQVGWIANPAVEAAKLKRRGLLPHLTGWIVIFVGLGETSAPQPPLPLPQQTKLASYWLAICHATGAAICRIDDMPRPIRPSVSTTPVPIVGVPPVPSVVGPRHPVRRPIPADQLFALNSAVLRPGADAILAPVAQQARRWGLLVSITGQASPDGGTTRYNTELSWARALAVRVRLIALGVPPAQIVRVVGIGTAHQTSDACYVQGHLDQGKCALLRRVVIVLSPASSVPS
jgi:outer membrane protein OmpA-like peptidoglycan-associated protein